MRTEHTQQTEPAAPTAEVAVRVDAGLALTSHVGVEDYVLREVRFALRDLLKLHPLASTDVLEVVVRAPSTPQPADAEGAGPTT